MAQSIAELKDTARQAVLILNRFTEADLPLTLRDAVERDWTGSEEILRELIGEELYDADRKKSDRARVIPLRKVLAIFDELRDELEAQTKLPGESLVGNLLKPVTAAQKFVQLGRSVLGTGALESADGRAALAALWEHLFEVLNAVTIARFAFDAFNRSRIAATKMRKAALPQRNGPRNSRRKRARL